ncbi:MAG: hypothetical protein U0L26_14655 [Cellulosilyticum sp.]|nr:hypothetical protein [Cellulosilyticum sp.]
MTLDEAIEHLEDSIKNKEFSCESCKKEHKQLLEWLKELRNLKEKKKTVQQTGDMQIIYDSEGKAHYFPKYAHNCRVFKIIRNQNKAED